ncbi:MULTISPECIES: hypothetical protein [Paraburkholderia]|uniref:hypothetical protein n=1 Tax=Paraburkholderia TaxID=1822464 RepID=UPI0003673F19|nr:MULTISPECIES: hypothetical protein [Paraburkholderia]MDH6147101.1 hypothetical protein [Paraburkholderia sp. WSM4179]
MAPQQRATPALRVSTCITRQSHTNPVRKHLDVVKVGGAVTYGNDFENPWSGIYHVDLTVIQKDRPNPTNIRFNYDHLFWAQKRRNSRRRF